MIRLTSADDACEVGLNLNLASSTPPGTVQSMGIPWPLQRCAHCGCAAGDSLDSPSSAAGHGRDSSLALAGSSPAASVAAPDQTSCTARRARPRKRRRPEAACAVSLPDPAVDREFARPKDRCWGDPGWRCNGWPPPRARMYSIEYGINLPQTMISRHQRFQSHHLKQRRLRNIASEPGSRDRRRRVKCCPLNSTSLPLLRGR